MLGNCTESKCLWFDYDLAWFRVSCSLCLLARCLASLLCRLKACWQRGQTHRAEVSSSGPSRLGLLTTRLCFTLSDTSEEREEESWCWPRPGNNTLLELSEVELELRLDLMERSSGNLCAEDCRVPEYPGCGTVICWQSEPMSVSVGQCLECVIVLFLLDNIVSVI